MERLFRKREQHAPLADQAPAFNVFPERHFHVNTVCLCVCVCGWSGGLAGRLINGQKVETGFRWVRMWLHERVPVEGLHVERIHQESKNR